LNCNFSYNEEKGKELCDDFFSRQNLDIPKQTTTFAGSNSLRVYQAEGKSLSTPGNNL